MLPVSALYRSEAKNVVTLCLVLEIQSRVRYCTSTDSRLESSTKVVRVQDAERELQLRYS